MEITDVKVKLVEGEEDRLRASCTITIDGEFVIRDVKVIEGSNGLFVAMPSRKLTDHCPKCRHKNHLRARYCNSCGTKLNEDRATRNDDRPIQLHAEIAHPINSECRERLQSGVLSAFLEEVENAGDGFDREPREYAERDERPQPQDRSQPREQSRQDDRPPRQDRNERRDGGGQRDRGPRQDRSGQPPHRPKREEPVVMQERPDDPAGYDDLISELKSDAQVRRKPAKPRDDFDSFDEGIDAFDDDDGDEIVDRFEDEVDDETAGAFDFDEDEEKVVATVVETQPIRPVSPVSPQQEEPEDDFGAGIL